jgi:maltooligosyltrehalose trehalohydrolase
MIPPNAAAFLLWAPYSESVSVHIYAPGERLIETQPVGGGYHAAIVHGVPAGATYKYRLDDGHEYPDPASRSQPEGVHGPSQMVESRFDWTDGDWKGLDRERYVLYELHTGAFTAEGTFAGVVSQLDYLAALGVTAIELMPVAQFPGARNWGYDGAFPYAVQNSYGGAHGLKTLVDAAHQRGLAVVLDVVYNHLGPEGNYLSRFGPYFTSRYHTPWGQAIDYDGDESGPVRRYFIENALQWIDEFHIDGLRLDAVHASHDSGTPHILQELAATLKQRARDLGRTICVFAESDLNDVKIVRKPAEGGYGLDAQWSDDFHHSLHTVLTRECSGYYCDFGSIGQLAKAFQNGFVYAGEFSTYRGREHGTETLDVPGSAFIVCSQNHDQIGNRMLGEPLSQMLSLEELKLAAGTVMLSPFLPLLFMGQEYGELAPFLYFVSHSDPRLVEAVRQGRRMEFAAFTWQGEVPDPQAEETFLRTRLNHDLRREPRHRVLLEFYRTLISMRRDVRSLAELNRDNVEASASEESRVLRLRRWSGSEQILALFHFSQHPAACAVSVPPAKWKKRLDSAEERWLGPGATLPDEFDSPGELQLTLPAQSVAVYITC